MAIAVGSTSITPLFGAGRTSSVFTAPSGIANGNLLVAVLHVGDATGLPPLSVTPPAGWTEVASSPSAVAKSDPYTIAMHVFYKVASGESGNYTFTHSSADTEGFMYRLTGADTTTPIDVTPEDLIFNGSTDGLTTSYASITPANDGCFLIFAESLWDGPTIPQAPSGTGPAITGRYDSGTLIYVGDGTQTTAGATGVRTRNPNGNNLAASAWATIVVPIRIAGAGAVAFTLGDYTLDNGLSGMDAVCDKVFVCAAAPSSYADATSGANSLGSKNWGAGAAFGSPAARAGGGRQITSAAITDGTISTAGTVAAWAAVDSANSRLLASGSLTGGKAVTVGQVFTLSAITIGIPNA